MERPDLWVVFRLLGAFQRSPSGRLRKTQLQMYSRVNYTVFSRYFEVLISRALVKVVVLEDGDWLEITPKGHEAFRFMVNGIQSILGNASADPFGAVRTARLRARPQADGRPRD